MVVCFSEDFFRGIHSSLTFIWANLTFSSVSYFQSLVWFYGISTTLGYLMPNPFLHI